MTELTDRTPPRKPGVRETNRAILRARILDTAEAMFADRGFHGLGMRDLTQRAGTRLAAVNDVFGSKENLFREVLLRRIVPLNRDRRSGLERLTESVDVETRVRALVEAFSEPMVRYAEQDRGWRAHFRLSAQLHGARNPVLLLVADEYNTIADEMVRQLGVVFPDAPRGDLVEAYLFLVSVSLQTFADNGRLKSLSRGEVGSRYLRARYARMVLFATGGIIGLLAAMDRRPEES
jgi:AcrR family transcriptional regulator